MASYRKHIGRISRDRASKIVTRQSRLGAAIKIHQFSSVPETSKERQLYDEFTEQIQGLEGRPTAQRRLEQLRIKAKVLERSIALKKRLGGRNPNVFQVLGAVALEHGLNSKELKESATALSAIYHYYGKSIGWEGDPRSVYTAIKLKKIPGRKINFPSGIEELLYKSKGKAVSSLEIAERLGIDWQIRHNQILINASLQFLEVCGLVKKMPSKDKRTGARTHLSVWAHRSHENPDVDYPNPRIHVLRKLFEGVTRTTELYKPQPGRTGNPDAIYRQTGIGLVIKYLSDAGLITKKSNRTGKLTYQTLQLTPEGRRLTKKLVENKSLPEALRKILLGTKQVKSQPKQ